MRKAELIGFQKFEIKEVPDPKPEKEEVIIKVNFCAICGTDLEPLRTLKEKGLDATYIQISMDLWNKVAGIYLYQTIGHEISGEITQIGEEVKNWNIGDKVVPRAYGGYADLVKASVKSKGLYGGLYKVPENVSMEEAAFSEPLAVAIAAVRRSEMKLGDKIAIFGAGPIGLLTLQCAKIAGASEIIVSEPMKLRREFAKKFGANNVINPLEEDPVEKIKELTNDEGVDVAFECSGNSEALKQAIDVARIGAPQYHIRGKVVIVGIHIRPATIYPNYIVLKNVELKGTIAYEPYGTPNDEFKIALKLLQHKKVDVKSMITGKFPLEKINEAFQEVLEGKHVKALIHP